LVALSLDVRGLIVTDVRMKPRRPTGHSRDRRGDIVRAALKVLQTKGYAALTARKVAAEADISLGHISYNFSGMDEVLSEAYKLASATLRAATDQGLETSAQEPIEQVRAYLVAGFGDYFLQPDHVRTRIDLWSAALAHPAIAETEHALYQRYRDELDALLIAVAGENPARRGKVQMVSDTIIATLDGLWLDWMRRRDSQAVQNGLDCCMYLVRKILAA
jgi:TetR/AcrR family transcriptional repressor of bet genes